MGKAGVGGLRRVATWRALHSLLCLKGRHASQRLRPPAMLLREWRLASLPLLQLQCISGLPEELKERHRLESRHPSWQHCWLLELRGQKG